MINVELKKTYHYFLLVNILIQLSTLIILAFNSTELKILISLLCLFLLSNIIIHLLFLRINNTSPETINFLKKINPYNDLNWDEILEKILEKEDALYKKIEETKTENRLYKLLINSFEDPVFVLNKSLDIIYSNELFEKNFHFNKKKYPYSLLEAIRDFELKKFIEDFIKDQKTNELFTSSIENQKHNSTRHFYIKIKPIKFTEHYLITFKDITDKKLAEVIREEFVANFSHEVRTPLTILLSEINSLKDDLLPIAGFEDTHKKQFDSIENNSKRLINLFEDILKLSKIETSHSIFKESFLIEPLVDNILTDLKKTYPEKDIEIKLNLNAAEINADYKLLELVIYNLIENSIKYSHKSLSIQINSEEDSKYTKLTIQDNGIGISEDHQGRVFERFFRVDNSRSQNVKGTGLGLAIVKHIMINHKGKIKLESKLDYGTKIKLYFPK